MKRTLEQQVVPKLICDRIIQSESDLINLSNEAIENALKNTVCPTKCIQAAIALRDRMQ